MGLLDRFRGRTTPALLCLSDALDALGTAGDLGTRHACVPVASIVGTEGRWHDFDGEFRPCARHLRAGVRRIEQLMVADRRLPPVRLVQLGELYFVVDGHHRVAAARCLRRSSLPATVHRIETVAWGEGCIRPEHLATKAAERRFLARVPLPDPVRCRQWLDHPDDWDRLADAAEAWGVHRDGAGAGLPDRCELADAWWREEVVPVVEERRVRDAEDSATDVQVYLDALRG